jgi:hypothetical protein
MKFEPYFYYVKNDSKKEPIDKVVASCKEHAVTYFAGRKKMEEEMFTNLYNVEIYEETKSK